MTKKTITLVGWGLIGVIMVAYAAVMLIATVSGGGAIPVKLIPGGRGGSQFPAAAIPFLIGLVVVASLWLRRIIGSRKVDSPPNTALKSDPQKRPTP